MSQEAIPKEVVFTLPSTLPAHRTFEFRANPTNANTFTTEGATIQFSLPKLERSFYQTNTIYVRGRLTLNIGVGTGALSVSVNDPNISLNSAGCYSLFSRMVTRGSGGQVLETQVNPGILSNIQMAYGLTPAERQGMNNLIRNTPTPTLASNAYASQCSSAGWAMGCASSIRGHSDVLDFVMPINGILTNCEKFLPASYDEFVIELTLANLISTVAGSQNPTFLIHKDQTSITGFTMTDLEICAQVFELSPPTYNQLMSMYPQGITLKSQSYMYGSASLPASSGQGNYDLNFSHRLQSVKQFIMAVSPTNAMEGQYAGVNPNLNTLSLIVGGKTYPERPIRCINPSEVYAQNSKAWGALMSDQKCGSIIPEHFAIGSTATGQYSAYLTYGASENDRQLDDLAIRSNRFYTLIDLESINGGKDELFNGVSTAGGSSSIIRLEIGSTLANVVHNVHYFSVYDALLKFDPVLGVSVVN
jgi:hypothetical protein